jgi:hypothetical protein
MSNAKRAINAGNQSKTRKPLRIKVFGACAELRSEKVKGGKSVGMGKVCRLTGQLLMGSQNMRTNAAPAN